MVRMTRDRMQHHQQQPQNQQHQQNRKLVPKKSMLRCCLAILMSAAMPLLFLLRMSFSLNTLINELQQQPQQRHQLQNDNGPTLQQQQKLLEQQQSSSLHTLQELPSPFTFLSDVLSLHPDYVAQSPATTVPQQAATGEDDSIPKKYLGSTIVELDHCQLRQTISNWSYFMDWSMPIVNGTVRTLFTDQENHMLLTPQDGVLMEQEFILELLEIYATRNGFCDFTKYQPTVPRTKRHDEAATVLQAWNATASTTTTTKIKPVVGESHETVRLPRFLVVIIAFRDIEQLRRLIQAMMIPQQHRFIIHLEQHTPLDYVTQVQQLCQTYPQNVVMIQFGTIVYRTESVSLVNLRIMRWAIHDLKLSYEYHVQIDGSAYPLWNAHELALHLVQQAHNKKRTTSVWLGELVNHHPGNFLNRKQLISTVATTASMAGHKLHKKLSFKHMKGRAQTQQPSSSSSSDHTNETATTIVDMTDVPDFVQNVFLRYKTISGNQAIYSHDTVLKLIDSPQVMELFALAKYSGFCCNEEWSWIAALLLLGDDQIVQDALAHTGMFHVWGGHMEQKCASSMKNAVLTANASSCYRLEHVYAIQQQNAARSTIDNTLLSGQDKKKKKKQVESGTMWGNETLDYLKQAKARGVWFARKFSSTDAQSMALLQGIQSQLHNPPPQEDQ